MSHPLTSYPLTFWPCDTCGAGKRERCRSRTGRPTNAHTARYRAWYAAWYERMRGDR